MSVPVRTGPLRALVLRQKIYNFNFKTLSIKHAIWDWFKSSSRLCLKVNITSFYQSVLVRVDFIDYIFVVAVFLQHKFVQTQETCTGKELLIIITSRPSPTLSDIQMIVTQHHDKPQPPKEPLTWINNPDRVRKRFLKKPHRGSNLLQVVGFHYI